LSLIKNAVNPAHRFADFSIHPTHPHFIVSILEDHTDDRPLSVVNSLVLINTDSKSVFPLVSGADFYSTPSFSPDGTHLTWQQWFHPDMPWEGAVIYVAAVSTSPDEQTLTLDNFVHVAGKQGHISATYPSWATNSTLLFTTDESGYQNPWVYAPSGTPAARPCLSMAVPEDFSRPPWFLGDLPSAIISSDGKYALFAATKEGRSVFYIVDTIDQSVHLSPVDCPYVDVICLRSFNGPQGRAEVVFIGAKVDEPPAIVHCHIDLTARSFATKFTTLYSTKSADSGTSKFPAGIVSLPRPLSLTVGPKKEPLHVVFYPPNNPEYEGTSLENEKPPCVVSVHGGPTTMAGQELSWSKQYFTSRGWAWYAVCYFTPIWNS
jgi:dipeptidyl aminopeptidase/acylaminoacyl peptidase